MTGRGGARRPWPWPWPWASGEAAAQSEACVRGRARAKAGSTAAAQQRRCARVGRGAPRAPHATHARQQHPAQAQAPGNRHPLPRRAPPQARPAGPRRPRRHTPAHAHQWKQKSRSLRVPGLGTRYGSHASSSATSSSKSTAMAAQGRGRAPPDCALLDSCSTAAPPATSIRLDFRLSGKKKKDIGAAGAIQSEHPYSII